MSSGFCVNLSRVSVLGSESGRVSGFFQVKYRIIIILVMVMI